LLFFSLNYLVVRYQPYTAVPIQAVRWILSWSYIREHILFLTIQSDSDEYVFIFRNTMMFISIDEYFLHTQVRVKQVHCVLRILYIYKQLLMVITVITSFFYITKLLNCWYEIPERLTMKNNTVTNTVRNIFIYIYNVYKLWLI